MCCATADIQMQIARGLAVVHVSSSGCAVAAKEVSDDVLEAFHDLVRGSGRDDKRKEMIKTIERNPKLIDARNKDGDMAIHLAARAGFLKSALVLIQLSARYHPGCMYETNREGNNPLHLVLMNGHYDMASVLHQSYPLKVWFNLNLRGISPIHLAIVAGYLDLVKVVLLREGSNERLSCGKNLLPKGQSLAKAAFEVGNQELLGFVRKKYPSLSVSYAATPGFYERVCALLQKSPGKATRKNKNARSS